MVNTKETATRAKMSKCVRLNDNNGFFWKFNKTKFRCPVRRELYYFFVKCYEQVLRRQPPSAVAAKQKFHKFRRFSEVLKPLPEGFQSFTNVQKRGALQKLIDEQEDEAAAVMILERDQDVDMQVNNPDNIQVDEGQAANINPDMVETLSHDASLQNVAWNELDNPQGRPPPSPYMHPYVLDQLGNQLDNPQGRPPPSLYENPYEPDQFLSELRRRASKFPEIWTEFKGLEEKFMIFIDKLDSLQDALKKDDSNTLLRRRQEEIYAQLEGVLASEHPQNPLGMPSMESSPNVHWRTYLLRSPDCYGLQSNVDTV